MLCYHLTLNVATENLHLFILQTKGKSFSCEGFHFVWLVDWYLIKVLKKDWQKVSKRIIFPMAVKLPPEEMFFFHYLDNIAPYW